MLCSPWEVVRIWIIVEPRLVLVVGCCVVSCVVVEPKLVLVVGCHVVSCVVSCAVSAAAQI